MKKLILTIVAAVTTAISSWAVGPGDIAFGGNITIAPVVESGASLTNFGIGAKFQYGILENVRTELDMDYFFKSKHIDIFDMSLDATALLAKINDENQAKLAAAYHETELLRRIYQLKNTLNR